MSTGRSLLVGLSVGGGILAPTLVAAALLPRPMSLELLSLMLFGIAAVYFGFAVSDGRWRDGVVQVCFMTVVFALTFLGAWFAPVFLAIGYFAHGLWDLIHHPKIQLLKTPVPEWYVYGCVSYDWAVAAFVVFAWVLSGPAKV